MAPSSLHCNLRLRRDAVLRDDPAFDRRPFVGGRILVRKGLGWALRERAYAAPAEVRDFCAEYRDRLSTLTLREALRVIDKR